MKFRVIFLKAASNEHSPIQLVEQDTGRGVGWINRYLDREYVRRLANTSLRIYAYNLLHFVRWWESRVHQQSGPFNFQAVCLRADEVGQQI